MTQEQRITLLENRLKGYAGLKTQSFEVTANAGEKTVSLQSLNKFAEGKNIVGISVITDKTTLKTPSGNFNYAETNNIFFHLANCDKTIINHNLSFTNIAEHIKSNARFYPISNDVVFEYSTINFAEVTATLLKTDAKFNVMITLHYN